MQALREEMTLAALAQKPGVHPTMITHWKHQLVEHAAELFERGAKHDDTASKVARRRTPGRRRGLGERQWKALAKDLRHNPREFGLEQNLWGGKILGAGVTEMDS